MIDLAAWNRQLILRLLISLALFLTLPTSSVAANPSANPRPALPDLVELQLSRLTLEEKIGQLFIITPDNDWKTQIRAYRPGGFILFSRHAKDLDTTLRLLDQRRQQSTILPFLAVDQEGGRVSRLPFATQTPPAGNLAGLSDKAVKNLGQLVGRELRVLGFNLNFAPVMDVDTCAENPVIGNRSFSADPYEVARLGRAYIQGLHLSGIATAAKHFPGHGDTHADSHLVLPTVNQPLERIETVELLPFRAAVLAGTDFIMMAHVVYPALDSRPAWPASLSSAIITDVLRQEIGYSGLVITDAMNMKAITGRMPAGDAAKTAFLAGVDMILMPEDFPAAYQALLDSVRSGEIPMTRLNASVRRILTLKARLADSAEISLGERRQKAAAMVGSSEHTVWLRQILHDAPELPESPK